MVSNTDLSEFYFGPHRVLGENSVSSSQPLTCVRAKPTPSFFAELTEFAAELSEFSLLEQYSRKQYSARSLFFVSSQTQSF